MFTLEVRYTERIYREDDGKFLGDFVHPSQKNKFKTLSGLKRAFNRLRENPFSVVDMVATDPNGQKVGEFIRNADGNVVLDNPVK